MTLFHLALSRTFLMAACCSTALACAGDDGEGNDAVTGNGVPYPGNAINTTGNMTNQVDMANGQGGNTTEQVNAMDGQGDTTNLVNSGNEQGTGGVMNSNDTAAGALGYSVDLGELFTTKCGACHSFWRSNDDTAYMRAFDLSEVLVAAVQGTFTTSDGIEGFPIMPYGCGTGPGDGSCLSQEEVDLISAWVAGGSQM